MYQPLYARLSDSAGGNGHTLSCRGRVDDIKCWINSKWGEVLDISVSLYEGKHIIDKPNLSRVPKAERDTVKAKYVADCELNDYVNIDITLKENPKFRLSIDGVRITKADLVTLRNIKKAIDDQHR